MKLNLIALSGLMVALAACASNPTTLPPGSYDKTMKSTDKYGTTTKETTSTDVYYDENGNKKAVVESKTTRDPKGLFNKSTSESTEVYKQ